ncbi:MAG: FTR1 family protein [Isosphaeraceae bacterium]|nr:FTR1 family protein [Isosphaeraceae bacterium]
MTRPTFRLLSIAFSLLGAAAACRAGDVVGKVEMSATCATIASPAVVTLEPIDKGTPIDATRVGGAAEVALVHQQGLQFEPRVQAVVVGQTVRFTNDDNETHNVHILTPGASFNQTMAPNRPVDYVTDKPGVLRLACDIHSHMRGFIVVSPTQWFSIVKNGRFRLDAVTPGRYRMVVWHEMGESSTSEITVADDRLDVGTIALKSNEPTLVAGAPTPVRAWSEVIDRISVKLAESRAFAKRSSGAAKARKIAEDAYWDEFESSDMETAVRAQLGFQVAGEIEGHFRDFRYAIRDLAQSKATPEAVVDRSRSLLLALYKAADELNRAGITDRTKLPNVLGASAAINVSTDADDVTAKKRVLADAFTAIQALADAPDASEAASSMTSAYFDAFEPIERILLARRPQDVRPLEIRFNAIRGEIVSGLRGEELASKLDGLRSDVAVALDKATLSSSGFLPAFVASLVTIVREGVEVILILTMLVALLVKTGRISALPAIRWGVGLAAVASLLTAVALQFLVAGVQGRARETVEGIVLLVASGVLFYVSYWLISQSEAKRWTDFLKRQVSDGARAGAMGTLGLTAFLAVYREGAETALMYQAMIAGHRDSRVGMLGLLAGVVVGIMILAVIYRLLKTSSVRLPLQSFFKITGALLFAMSVVFAGHGVFELQQAGFLRVTEARWMAGVDLAWLGVYPNLQALAVQGLLVGGALVSLLWPMFDRRSTIAESNAGGKRSEPAGAAV